MSRDTLSIAQARRVALAAQGLDRPRPEGEPNRAHMRRLIRRLGLLQLDFVNVLVPAHYLVVFSRLGGYRRERLDELIYRSGEFIEHWAHEASIVPADCWPLLDYRRRSFRPWPGSPIMKLPDREDYLELVHERVREQGPLLASDLPPVEGPPRKPGDWHRSLPRWALEVHFGHGRVSVSDRMPNFQRVYDLAERVVPEPHFSQPVDEEEAHRRLLATAARAHGVGTASDLADYFRMNTRASLPRIAELVEEGVLHPVSVEGWRDPAYLHRDARVPRRVEARSVLSPFDPLVWYRPRGERLFGFHYRIEIYVPAAKRRFGYYVLPFLLGERIVARVDLKADRRAGSLRVLNAHLEAESQPGEVAGELAAELEQLAHWLGLEQVAVTPGGELASALRKL